MRIPLIRLILAILLLANTRTAMNDANGSQPGTLPHGFVRKAIDLPDGESRRYAMFVPRDYAQKTDQRWPLIVFLHGSGERGSDGIRQTTVGLPEYITERPRKFPFLVLMPQAHGMWFRGKEALAVWAMLDKTIDEYRVDTDRIYLTGLSMGGFGTWELAMQRPDIFAAVAPVCGVGPTELVGNIRHVPVWAFHGAQDGHVPPDGSRRPVEALKQIGADVRYSEYPDVGHKSWEKAYWTPQLYSWFLSHRRRPAPREIDYLLLNGPVRVWWLALQPAPGVQSPPRVHAKVDEDGRIDINSTGIESFAIASTEPPIKPGDDIKLVWNGTDIYEGRFSGALIIQPTTQPADTADDKPRE